MDQGNKGKWLYARIDYEGNNAFCTKCGLLGHVAGVCRKGQKKPTNNVTKQDKPKQQWEEKNKGRATPNKSPPVTTTTPGNGNVQNMATDPQGEIIVPTPLAPEGRASDLSSSTTVHTSSEDKDNRVPDPSPLMAAHQSDDTITHMGLDPVIPQRAEVIREPQIDAFMSDPLVIGGKNTPTKNRFQVLEMDVTDYQEQPTGKELMFISYIPEGYLSYGTGTTAVRTIVVPFLKSAANFEDEMPPQSTTKRRNNKHKGGIVERRVTRSVKHRTDPTPKQ